MEILEPFEGCIENERVKNHDLTITLAYTISN